MTPQLQSHLVICDAQVHAPKVDAVTSVNGLDEGPLLAQMDAASVDRAIIVTLPTRSKPADNEASLAIARRHPDRFRVMGLLDTRLGPVLAGVVARWRETPNMLGIRVSCSREPFRSMLLNDDLDWLWIAAERHDVPVMLNAPEMIHKARRIAERHPDLRLIVDHLGLRAHPPYADLTEPIKPLLTLADRPNVAAKATSVPSIVDGPYPFFGAHDAIRMVVDAFGAARVFWGSDITRLPCPYTECLTMFTEELPFLSSADKRLIMGRGICDWLGWDAR